MNSALLGWGLVAAAVAAGYIGYGWRGVALAITVTVFWLLLQFSRGVRALRDAAGNPVGHVPNAVMLHARLRSGMRLPDILKTTRSLGRPVSEQPEVWAWVDEGGDEVQVTMQDGRVRAWALKRAAAPDA